jgi:hypothetical protein
MFTLSNAALSRLLALKRLTVIPPEVFEAPGAWKFLLQSDVKSLTQVVSISSGIPAL